MKKFSQMNGGSHEDIVDLEEWFTKIAEQFAGEYDGWGCTTYVYDLDEEEDEAN